MRGTPAIGSGVLYSAFLAVEVAVPVVLGVLVARGPSRSLLVGFLVYAGLAALVVFPCALAAGQ